MDDSSVMRLLYADTLSRPGDTEPKGGLSSGGLLVGPGINTAKHHNNNNNNTTTTTADDHEEDDDDKILTCKARTSDIQNALCKNRI